MVFEYVQPNRSLKVVHDYCAIARTDRQALRCHVKVHCWESGNSGRYDDKSKESGGKVRFYNVTNNLGCCIEDRLAVCCGVGIQ